MGKVIETVLEILQKQAEETVDILDIMFSDRSTSYRKARRSLLRGTPSFKNDWADWYRQKQSFYSLMNKLKREGLITKKMIEKNSPWHITKQGLVKLLKIKKSTRKNYCKEASKNLKIISFDVPERERRKRDFLRRELVSLGFNKLQQSVWAGKIEIPEDFIKYLKDEGLLTCVQIFSVDKEGTITTEKIK